MKKIIAALGTTVALMALLPGPAQGGREHVHVGDVRIAAPPVVGATLTATPGTWSPGPDSRSYEWLRDGEGEVIGRASSYRVTAADLGHTLTVVERVTFGSQLDESSSVTTTVVAGLTAPRATVSGSLRVGRTLRVGLAGGTSGASTAVQWLRDGAAIRGAVGRTYTLGRDDAGRRLSVRTVTTKAGQSSVTGSSAVVRVRALVLKRPVVKGTAEVGKRLTARSKGTWLAPGHTYRYQWLRDGAAIRGATKSSYRLTAKDRKKKVSVRVTARKSGFPAVSSSSRATKRVR